MMGWKERGRKRASLKIGRYLSICLVALRKTAKVFICGVRPKGLNLNPVPSEYESGFLTNPRDH